MLKQKQPSRGFPRKRYSENTQQIYWRTPMSKCDFRRPLKVHKDDFYFLGSDTYCNCHAEVSGKRCNLKDGEELQVPCKIIITGQKNM